MKKLIASIVMMFAAVVFAHPHGGDVKLENAVNYHSVKGALHTHLSVGTHDGELHAILGDLGIVDIEKTNTGYETSNKMIKITTNEKNAKLEAKILLFDRSFYAPEKFEPETSFHSYNAGFPHLHVDFLKKDLSEVKLQENDKLIFKGSVKENPETKDRIFTEKDGKFQIILFGKYDDKSSKLNKLSRTAILVVNMDLFKLDNDHHHKH